MRTYGSRLLRVMAASGCLFLLAAAGGCGEEGTSDAPLSEEAKKADSNMQNAMKDFMKTKNQPSAKQK